MDPQASHRAYCEPTANASHDVSVYTPAVAGTHCAYSLRDGQAELALDGWLHNYLSQY